MTLEINTPFHSASVPDISRAESQSTCVSGAWRDVHAGCRLRRPPAMLSSVRCEMPCGLRMLLSRQARWAIRGVVRTWRSYGQAGPGSAAVPASFGRASQVACSVAPCRRAAHIIACRRLAPGVARRGSCAMEGPLKCASNIPGRWVFVYHLSAAAPLVAVAVATNGAIQEGRYVDTLPTAQYCRAGDARPRTGFRRLHWPSGGASCLSWGQLRCTTCVPQLSDDAHASAARYGICVIRGGLAGWRAQQAQAQLAPARGRADESVAAVVSQHTRRAARFQGLCVYGR